MKQKDSKLLTESIKESDLRGESCPSIYAILTYGMQLLLLRRVRLLLKLVGVRVARRIGVLSFRFEWWYKWGSVGPIALLLCSCSFRVLELS